LRNNLVADLDFFVAIDARQITLDAMLIN